jgi:hypothetical protein
MCKGSGDEGLLTCKFDRITLLPEAPNCPRDVALETFSGTDPRTACIFSGSDTVAVGKGDGTLQISSQDSAGIHYQLSGLTDYLVTYAFDCPGTPTGHSTTHTIDWASATNRVSVDPAKLEGTSEVNYPGDPGHWGGLGQFRWLLTTGTPSQ